MKYRKTRCLVAMITAIAFLAGYRKSEKDSAKKQD